MLNNNDDQNIRDEVTILKKSIKKAIDV